uniref:NB-ARC domain-containing protein n=1 Tax=Aegilops tauschii subsp. strangulata TaxID=200361 RepID=A0A453A9C8_AEGTS
MRLGSHGALESLEIAIVNMAEFIVLLGGCERMSRRPYDVYLYTENFMFGRHTEKQKVLSFLLEHNNPPGDHGLTVLPIIGGVGVGKKTLVAHVCVDERVQSHFSSILHLNGHDLLTILDHGRTMFGKMLVVIEFASDVDDDEWKKFHLFLGKMSRGSKIIIISKVKRLARFG